jgi:uncharacterized protein (TIGR02145 family)
LEFANDPSPAGWRVPTFSEIYTLLDEDVESNKWVTTPVSGRLFTDKMSGNTLFLPAVGGRLSSDGSLFDAGLDGNYWSSTAYGAAIAYYMSFFTPSVDYYYDPRGYGYTVRCVAK